MAPGMRVHPIEMRLSALARPPRSILASSAVALKVGKPDTDNAPSNSVPQNAPGGHRTIVPTSPDTMLRSRTIVRLVISREIMLRPRDNTLLSPMSYFTRLRRE